MRAMRFAIAAVMVATAGQLQAGIIVFTDRTAWEAAVAGTIATEDFNGVANQILSSGTTTLGTFDVTLNANDAGNLNNVSGGVLNFRVSNWVGGDPVTSFIDIAPVSSSLLSAFGADFVSTTTGAKLKVTLMLNGSTVVFSDHLSGVGTGFLGVVDDMTPFSSLRFEAVSPASDNSAEVFSLDNLSTSVATVAPEPTSLALAGFAGIGMAAGAWRRRRQQAA